MNLRLSCEIMLVLFHGEKAGFIIKILNSKNFFKIQGFAQNVEVKLIN